MERIERTPAVAAALVDRLLDVRELANSPRAERAWIVEHGEYRRYEKGDLLVDGNRDVPEMIVLLAGRIVVYLDHGSGRLHSIEEKGGAVTGVLPYSRMRGPIGRVVIEEAAEMLAIPRDLLPELTRSCPVITTELVHRMVDRARQIVATDWQDEKMVALGRLAAGLSHELNNPASAAARQSRALHDTHRELSDSSRQLGALGLPPDQVGAVEAALERIEAKPEPVWTSPLHRTDMEESLVDWLAEHGGDPRCAVPLVESGVGLDDLLLLEARLPPPAIGPVLRWLAARLSARSIARDVERATMRMHELVSSVRRFTFMDRAGGPVPTDIALGLRDTVAVLAFKAREKDVTVSLNIADGLPMVLASVAELNQVWSNLLDNALDATMSAGEVAVDAGVEGDVVVVRFRDTGAGIPAHIIGHIFDPFFTTKPVGKGVGLGLDIALRVVRAHGGQIDVESVPGRTEVRVRLPRC